MTSKTELDGEIVKHGTWLYDGSVPLEIIIVRRDVLYGSGDYEDPPEIQDDRQIETFEILYEGAGEHGRFNAGGGQFTSLQDAVKSVEKAVGKTLRWL